MSDPLFHIDVMLTESAISERFIAALRARFLPEPFFYWSPLSVRAWLALCREGPYRNYIRSETLVRTHADTIAAALPAGPIEVISLGAGQGTKDRHVLENLARDGREMTYVPVDSGQVLLESACAQAHACGVPHRGVKADITDPTHLAIVLSRSHGRRRVVMILGNTLGAFDPPAMLRAVHSHLGEGDLLVVDGELGHDGDTKAGYENPDNRSFALAPLRSIGIKDEDGKLIFEFHRGNSPGLYRLEKCFRTEVDLALQVGGAEINIRAGESIRMNHSGKYTQEAFRRTIVDGGFEQTADFYSEDSRFVMVIARPRPQGR
ncbi:MAG: L-histidine N(alpha)-methyltransferase [Nitrospiraceae bacterium]|nr:L-histidine N(alpha)-methyltransferase [Nitrospiraceae bacterium]